jgi:hypothetical protein
MVARYAIAAQLGFTGGEAANALSVAGVEGLIVGVGLLGAVVVVRLEARRRPFTRRRKV